MKNDTVVISNSVGTAPSRRLMANWYTRLSFPRQQRNRPPIRCPASCGSRTGGRWSSRQSLAALLDGKLPLEVIAEKIVMPASHFLADHVHVDIVVDRD